jgi:capsular exopolysaccharide synthesis family protein
MKSHSTNPSTQESYIIELFKIVLPYKWLIFFLMILFMFLAKFYLYFIPSTYESYAIIKVKINKTNIKTTDVLNDNLFKINSAGVDEEISLLQTYQIHQKVIDKNNLEVQYFREEAYKKIELYKNSPITISNISNLVAENLTKYLILRPVKDGFTLESKKLKDSKIYKYNELITTPYFTGKVTLNEVFTVPIYLQFNGDTRDIYENIIKKRLSVSRLELDSNLIVITYQDTIPERANAYIDTLIETYIKQSIESKNRENNKILTFLEERLESTRLKLEKSENELENYKSNNKSVAPAIKLTDSFTKLSDLDLELSEIQLKDQLLKNLITFMEHNKDLDAIAPTLLEFNDQTTIRLINTLQELQTTEDELRVEFTDNYPALIQVRKRMERTKRKIALNVKNLKSILVSKRKNLLKQKSKYEKTLKTLPKKEKKLIHFQRNYDVDSKMYNYLLEKKSENELIKVASVSNYEAVDKAYTPSKPIKPKRFAMLIIAAILGMVLGIIIALLRALFIDKVKKAKEIPLLTNLPLYGKIPLYKNNMLNNVPLDEAYRQLAINLQFKRKEHEGNIVLISSTSQGEGKTSTLVHLTSIFRQTPVKSIIIDLDMHNPSLHRYFGLEQQYSGISTYLSQRDNLGNIIFTTNHPNLDIIPAGPIPPNPLELILSTQLHELFQTLKQQYDYIFVDTGSLDIAPEVYYLMQYADMNLIVLRENYTKKSSIMELEKQMQEKNITNVGLVLKSTPEANELLLQQSKQLLNLPS